MIQGSIDVSQQRGINDLQAFKILQYEIQSNSNMQIKMELYSLSYKLNWEKHKYDSLLCYKAMLDL